MDRRTTALCMREVLEHLNRCCEQWQAADGRNERFVEQSVERDLAELQRIWRAARRMSLDLGAECDDLVLRAA